MIAALIGCGKMGSALLRGWLSSGIAGGVTGNITKDIAEKIYVLDPAGLPDEFQNAVTYLKTADNVAVAADVFVLAVKPQIMDEICAALTIPDNALVLSIAAGQSLCSFEKRFCKNQPVVRAMPNLPAAIGQGISVAIANENVTQEQKQLAETLLKSTGLVEWVEDESLLNSVTAVSGSGPAYVFLLIEMLARAGEKAGLPSDLSMKLARQTVIGSAALADSKPAVPASVLRENVTSPGGTTAAALKVLMAENGLQNLFDRAIAAAAEHGKTLGS